MPLRERIDPLRGGDTVGDDCTGLGEVKALREIRIAGSGQVSFTFRLEIYPQGPAGRCGAPPGIIAPEERLPVAQALAMGVQHVVATFGLTMLAPLLMEFVPNLCLDVGYRHAAVFAC